MKYLGYKVLLSVLKVLVYLKRGLFWFGGRIFKVGKYVQSLFEGTIGFRLYKVHFFLKKRFDRSKNPWTIRILDFLGSRGTLQTVLLFVFIIIMYPHSGLYSEDTLGLPGRKTPLYQLLGPGDQDFEDIEEFEAEQVLQPETSWREGTIAYNPNAGTNVSAPEETGISGVGPGGTALVRPNILPGANLPVSETQPTAPAPGQRRGVAEYIVQGGDVIGAIATKFGVSVNTILWANNLTFRSRIHPGDKLLIPPGTGVIHIVKKGDNLGKIARTYNVQNEQVVAANDLRKDGAGLQIGQPLFIPGGEKVPNVVAPRPVLVEETRRNTGIDKIAAPQPSVEAPAGSGYIWPTDNHRINQYFGLRHTGVDIAGKIGNTNYAARSGRVIKSQDGWNGGYGSYVIIDHGGGVTTLYAHNHKRLVSVGDYVDQGQPIGLLGSTGRSTGPHLHFEVRVNGKKGNPLKYVR